MQCTQHPNPLQSQTQPVCRQPARGERGCEQPSPQGKQQQGNPEPQHLAVLLSSVCASPRLTPLPRAHRAHLPRSYSPHRVGTPFPHREELCHATSTGQFKAPAPVRGTQTSSADSRAAFQQPDSTLALSVSSVNTPVYCTETATSLQLPQLNTAVSFDCPDRLVLKYPQRRERGWKALAFQAALQYGLSCISLQALVEHFADCLLFLEAHQVTSRSMTLVLDGNQRLALLCNAVFTVGAGDPSQHPRPTERWSNTSVLTGERALSSAARDRHCRHAVALFTFTLVQSRNLRIDTPKLVISLCS